MNQSKLDELKGQRVLVSLLNGELLSGTLLEADGLVNVTLADSASLNQDLEEVAQQGVQVVRGDSVGFVAKLPR